MTGSARRIIHVDMDCFYAAVEMRERPELKNRPIAVGGSSGRGVLTTCNYHARKFGIRSAMPAFKAKQLCPNLVMLPVRFDLYREASRKVREVFARYASEIEPLSLDEAYLDVSHHKRAGAEIAHEIRAEIYKATQLTASAGIGPNKLIAKIASDLNKPDGQCVVSPSRVDEFMQSLPVKKLWGIGPKSAGKFHELGIHTCGDLRQKDKAWLGQKFGSFGFELYRLCRGIDDRPVRSNRVRKSLSTEHTFSANLETLEDCMQALDRQFEELLEDIRRSAPDRAIAKLVLKLKFSDFKRTTAEVSAQQPNLKIYQSLLKEAWGRSGLPVRLLGVGVRFAVTRHGPVQLELGFA